MHRFLKICGSWVQAYSWEKETFHPPGGELGRTAFIGTAVEASRTVQSFLPPLLSWEAKACHLSGSRGNRGSSQAQTPLDKGLTDISLDFGFAKKGWAPISRSHSEPCAAHRVSYLQQHLGYLVKKCRHMPDPLPWHLTFLWLIWGLQLPKDQSWVSLLLGTILAYRNNMGFVNFSSSDIPSCSLWPSSSNFQWTRKKKY